MASNRIKSHRVRFTSASLACLLDLGCTCGTTNGAAPPICTRYVRPPHPTQPPATRLLPQLLFRLILSQRPLCLHSSPSPLPNPASSCVPSTSLCIPPQHVSPSSSTMTPAPSPAPSFPDPAETSPTAAGQNAAIRALLNEVNGSEPTPELRCAFTGVCSGAVVTRNLAYTLGCTGRVVSRVEFPSAVPGQALAYPHLLTKVSPEIPPSRPAPLRRIPQPRPPLRPSARQVGNLSGERLPL